MSDEKIITNPVKAIRAFCLDCCGGSRVDVEECTDRNCALYNFRLGKNPYRAHREYSEERKIVMRERLSAAREKKAQNRKTI